jgi:hypothetical protein
VRCSGRGVTLPQRIRIIKSTWTKIDCTVGMRQIYLSSTTYGETRCIDRVPLLLRL